MCVCNWNQHGFELGSPTVDGQNPVPLQSLMQKYPRAPLSILEAGTWVEKNKSNAQNPAPPYKNTKTTLNMGERGWPLIYEVNRFRRWCRISSINIIIEMALKATVWFYYGHRSLPFLWYGMCVADASPMLDPAWKQRRPTRPTVLSRGHA